MIDTNDMYEIAGLQVKIPNPGETLYRQAAPYKSGYSGLPDLLIEPDGAAMSRIRNTYPKETDDMLNYVLTNAMFYAALLDHNGFGLHASAISYEGRAILFSAPCGTGKSTHAKLWLDYFGENRVFVINDDKPALRLGNSGFDVYGTPWSGKTDLSRNVSVPLLAVVFLEQADHNSIRKLDGREAAIMLYYQSMKSQKSRERMEKLLDQLDRLIRSTDVYKLSCRADGGAVETAYRAVMESGK
jgi:hypothetical protein